jgi:hypothetical protein
MSRDPLPARAPRPALPALPALPPLPAPPRPTWFDYVFILMGCGLSMALTDLSRFEAHATAGSPALPALVLRWLPHLLFLPLGLLLLWPLFFLTQKCAGRVHPLTPAEWLWGVAWLGAVALTVWIAWQFWGTPPEFLTPASFKGTAFVGYALAMLAMGAVGIVIGLVDLIGRWPRPWTHPFCLALVMWPSLPLLALLLWHLELK